MTPDDILRHIDSGRPWPDTATLPADAGAAYQTAIALRAARTARGERPVGYKVGFTNRHIWPIYGVSAPIWGTVWDSTYTQSDEGATLDLAHTCQPRLEPEVAFGLAATPPAGPTLDELFACVDWIAPSFEVVQSHRPGWKCTLPETVADGALHARLLVGRRTPIRDVAPDAASLNAVLARLAVTLVADGTPRDRGVGANVLDGPLHALRHFVHELQACPGAPDLRAGDVVSTGVWTDAWPVQAGEHWRAEFDAPIGALQVRFRQSAAPGEPTEG